MVEFPEGALGKRKSSDEHSRPNQKKMMTVLIILLHTYFS